jgi:hypothetical protein
MSLAQREVWDKGKKEKEMSNRHIEIIRFNSQKIHIREYLNGTLLNYQPTYQPAAVKIIAARLLIINPDTQEEYYDCRYDDCTIKRMFG